HIYRYTYRCRYVCIYLCTNVYTSQMGVTLVRQARAGVFLSHRFQHHPVGIPGCLRRRGFMNSGGGGGVFQSKTR
ncbi:MAG: hypothetical protein ACK55Z_24125, partial [bacterium]